MLSLLVQALYAVKRGDDQRALLFFGVSLLALKSSKASLLVQGAIQANELRERFMIRQRSHRRGGYDLTLNRA